MSQIKKIGVIGAGNMGSGIAQKTAQEGLEVVMVDIKAEFVERGLNTMKQLLQQGVERKIFTPEQVAAVLGRVSGSTDFNAVADADLVIEAVFEDKSVKHEVFNKLDKACSAETILATNTSSFYVSEFAQKTSRPDRFVGLHYFYHPAKNRLVEVIPGAGTSKEAIDKTLLLAKLQGKTPIVVKDAPGFAVNRFFVPFLNEAARMLEEGFANIATIEEAAKRALKIGMGPFELMNVTGIPIAVHATTALGNELGPFYMTTPIIKTQMEKGTDWPLDGEVDEAKLEAVKNRILGVCLGVAASLVDEGVASIEDTDVGAKVGLRWIQGPFEIMNRIGIDKTHELVQAIAQRYEDFKMPQVLIRQKELGKPFEFNFVDLKVKDQIAYITFNRPDAMNAINPTVVAQLDQRFTAAEADPAIKAIVFQGAGKAFVAGADIRYFVEKIKADKVPDIIEFTRKGHELYMRIENCAKPTIVILDGLSLGGGSEMALAAQAIVATPAGSLGFPETGIGIYPGLGGMTRTARQVGDALAKYYVFTGATLTAQDAYDLGMVAKLVAPAEIDAAVKELVAKGLPDKYRAREIPERFQALAKICSPENVENLLAQKPLAGVDEALAAKVAKTIGLKAPLALKLATEIMDSQSGTSMAQAAEIELGRLKDIFATADAFEGLSTVGRKRPEYKGK